MARTVAGSRRQLFLIRPVRASGCSMADTLAMDMTKAAKMPAQQQPRLVRKTRAWHRRSIVGQVDHAFVLKRVNDESGWSGRYAFMTAMSAGIAILGLLLSSPAVIIGAMLISPLMAPIIGLGFALATVDWPEVRRSLLALVAGTFLAVGFTALIVLLSPLQDITPEILARTRPSLFDLLVAIFSALAGGYATVRGRGETIVGVAIATALMPPLAVVGYGLATQNMPIFAGSLALFVTNFIAISLSAALVARFYGFGTQLSPKQTRRQAGALLMLFLVLAVPLALSLRQIAWEAWATRSARNAVTREFGPNSRIVTLDPDFSREKVLIRTTVLTDRLHAKASADLERRLSDMLQKPVQVQLSQVLVNQGDGQAELNRARAADAEARADQLARADMAARLSLVSGVPVDQVLVDSVARVATVQALGKTGLVELMQSETRLADDSPGWSISLLPPPGPLPELSVEGDEPTPDELLMADAVAWALKRKGTASAQISARRLAGEPIARTQARAAAVAALLEARGVTVNVADPRPISRAFERDNGLVAARSVEVTPLPPQPAINTEDGVEPKAGDGKARIGEA